MAAIAPETASPSSEAGPAAQVSPHWMTAPGKEEAVAEFLPWTLHLIWKCNIEADKPPFRSL